MRAVLLKTQCLTQRFLYGPVCVQLYTQDTHTVLKHEVKGEVDRWKMIRRFSIMFQ